MKPLRPELQGLTTQALEAEVQRLRQELTRAQNTHGAENSGQGHLPHIVWVAIAVSSVGLLFAVIAILNHG